MQPLASVLRVILASALLSLSACRSVQPMAPAPASASNQPRLPIKDNFYIFVLIGQSNMAGRGTIEPEDQVPIDRVLTLNAAGEWVPAIDPIHFDKPVAGTGLGRTFGAEIARDHPGATIGLVPCAVGGSPIDSWQPGAFYSETKSFPWDDALRRARLALQTGTLKGILWHQGESDSNSANAPAYAGKIADLVARLRAALNAPDVPFLAGEMGHFPGKPWDIPHDQVDRATRALVDLVPHTAYVSSEGLTDRGDQLHFNSASYREFGRRYADAYRQMSSHK